MKQRIIPYCAIVLLAALLAGRAIAQSTPGLSILKGRPDNADATALTGPVFDDPVQGISLHPPAGADTVQENLAPGDIVQFVNHDSGWVLKVSRAVLPKPIPLATPKSGLLDLTAQQFKAANPSAEILRQQVEHADKTDYGVLIARYTLSNQLRLMQQAMFRATDEVYYVLTMTSPATPGAGADSPLSDQQRAQHTFAAVIGSVQLIDRTKIKEDQDQRLFRTRALLSLRSRRTKSAKSSFPSSFSASRRTAGILVIVISSKRLKSGLAMMESASAFARTSSRRGQARWIRKIGSPVRSIDKQEEWSTAAMTTDGQGAKTGVSELGTSDAIYPASFRSRQWRCRSQ